MRKFSILPWLICIIVLVCSIQIASGAQVHLRARLDSLATHAAHTSHGLMVLMESGDHGEDFGMALARAITFNQEFAAVSNWARVAWPGAGGVVPVGREPTFTEEDTMVYSQLLSEYEIRLRKLTQQRWITRRAVREVSQRIYNDMTQYHSSSH